MKQSAYSFDENGYFAGEIRKQESPLEPGVFFLPRNACDTRPPFMEGFRAKWNGSSWDLEKRNPPAQKRGSFIEVLEDQQSKIISDIEKSVRDLISVDLSREIKSSVEVESSKVRELLHRDGAAIYEELLKKMNQAKSEISLSGEIAVQEVVRIYSEIIRMRDELNKIKEQSVDLFEKIRTENKMKVEEVAEVQKSGVWSKMISWFSSAPQVEEPKKDISTDA